MNWTVQEIAARLGGVVHGDADALIAGVRGIQEAEDGDLTFLANRRYRSRLKTTRATAVLVAPGTEEPGRTLIVVADPYVAFGQALALFHPREPERPGIHERAFVDRDARVSPEATVHAGATVSRGARSRREPCSTRGYTWASRRRSARNRFCTPSDRVSSVRIGKRVILHAGVVVGGDGFGFARPGWVKHKDSPGRNRPDRRRC